MQKPKKGPKKKNVEKQVKNQVLVVKKQKLKVVRQSF